MQSNKSIDDWNERQRRQINAFYIFLSLICVGAAFAWSPIALLPLLMIAMFAGMSNVSLLLGRPRIQGTDAEIRAAAATGPAWFQRAVAKLETEN